MTLKTCSGYEETVANITREIDIARRCIAVDKNWKGTFVGDSLLKTDEEKLVSLEHQLNQLLGFQFYDKGLSEKDKAILAIMKSSDIQSGQNWNKMVKEVKVKKDMDAWVYHVPKDTTYLLMKDISFEVYRLVNQKMAEVCSLLPNFKFQVVT